MARRWEPVLEEVARERWSRLLARAALLVPTRADAEDLVQDALVATFSSRARLTTVAEAEQYVRRAIVTRSVDRARSAAAERRAVERSAARAVPAVDLVPEGLGRDVVAALLALSPRQRACVVLRHLEDLSVAETAHLLGIGAGAVKRYTSEGAARLQEQLGASAPYDGGHVPVRLVEREETRRD